MNNKLGNHKVRVYRSSNPLLAEKIRPNDPCPCGSGKKAKKCCGTKTKYYELKPIEQ